jgi:hypothetical protein
MFLCCKCTKCTKHPENFNKWHLTKIKYKHFFRNSSYTQHSLYFGYKIVLWIMVLNPWFAQFQSANHNTNTRIALHILYWDQPIQTAD